MILLLAVVAGLAAGQSRAWLTGRSLHIPDLRLIWLVPVAYLPQFVAFQLPATRGSLPDQIVAVALVSSLLLLLIFAWANRKQPGGWLLGTGLVLNLVVILLNGGLMPISPETVTRIAPNAPAGAWQVGKRMWTSKDIILPLAEMRLWWLSDRFLLPDWIPYHVAFSFGDILIALGAFWLLWSLGGQNEKQNYR
jgi:hypothetical protein